jgi:hypothetical protein
VILFDAERGLVFDVTVALLGVKVCVREGMRRGKIWNGWHVVSFSVLEVVIDSSKRGLIVLIRV